MLPRHCERVLTAESRPAIEPRQIVVIILRRFRGHDGVAETGVFAGGVIDVLANQAGLQLDARGAREALRAVTWQRCCR